MESKISDIVMSLTGRDRERLFFVVHAEPDYLYLADGRLRRIEKPKKKKRKHTLFIGESNTRAALRLRNGEKVSNSEMRRSLEEHIKAAGEAD
ncbi:MAG: hypothetical protein Q8878_02880 [Bacillota bacterium]|nr:hypothetical protein [Bacillota bacterium]